MRQDQRWTLPRIAMLVIAFIFAVAMNALVTGGSVATNAAVLALSFAAMVLLIASDALGYFR
jgi:hypothetical protein